MIWDSDLLKSRLPSLIDKYENGRVVNCAYELALGAQAFTTRDRNMARLHLQPGRQVIIGPGEFALLLTEESITVPDDAMAFISVRTRYTMRGLINVSGFHVDPGFSGHLQFSVYNAGSNPVSITRGDQIFLLWFVSLSHPTTDLYRGRRGRSSIPDEDIMAIAGQAYSPLAVSQRLDRLAGQIVGMWWLLGGAFAAAVAAALAAI